MQRFTLHALVGITVLGFAVQAQAQEAVIGGVQAQVQAQQASNEELAKQLSNPVASLISLPFQFNYDQNIGLEDDGDRWTLNIQPVVPFELNENWNLISRTILPVIYQNDVFPGAGDQSGIGDIVQSLFFSPKQPIEGWILGAGPVFLISVGSSDFSAEKWGAGPTVVGLKQDGPWTYGALVNHIWSFAGDDDRADINATFLQPFISHTTPSAVTYSLNTESTYDWENEQWNAPVNAAISKVFDFGSQKVSLQGALRYYIDSPDSGPEDWGFRFTATWLFPE